MAASVATITQFSFPNGRELTAPNGFVHLYGTISLSAGTYTQNGIPLVWLGQIKDQVNSTVAPKWVEIFSAGSPPSLYDYIWDSVNDTLRILISQNTAATGTAPFSEFQAGANLPGPIIADVINFHAIFQRV